jgi:hypothetical protein
MEGTKRYVIQERDRAALKHVIKHGACTAPQLARDIYGGSIPVTQRRIRALSQAGLVRTVSSFSTSTVCVASARGCRQAGLGISPMPLSRAALLELPHVLGAVDLAAYLVTSEQVQVWTERQFRKLRREDKVPADLPIPDLVIRTPGGGKVVCVELELNAKTTTRYRQLLARYATAGQSVRYYAVQAGLLRRIDAVVAELGMTESVSTFLWRMEAEVGI